MRTQIAAMMVVFAAVLVFGTSGPVRAVTLVEDFSGGIPSGWVIESLDANGAPWTLTAPDEMGWLQIAKAADDDPLTAYQAIGAGITSQFMLVGDFSIWMNFNLVDFPASNGNGWNEALLNVNNAAGRFEVLRARGTASNFVEGYSTQSLGAVADSTTEGLLGITRQGQTLSAWIDDGSGPVLVGSDTSPALAGPMRVFVEAAQQEYDPYTRPSTALDVRFNDISITADTITPEPSTLALLGAGAVGVLAYGWRRRRCAR